MNILHMKYAVEVAKAGSVNKASEVLLVAQPNLSRSIRELEADLGFSIFDRSAKGMVLTSEGEEFIGYAKNILSQIDAVEQMYHTDLPAKQKFSISVPRASYISDAFAHFSKYITADRAELFYKETNSSRTIQNVLDDDYKLGIIRYAASHDRRFREMLESRELAWELVAEFSYMLVFSKASPLADRDAIRYEDLRPLIEIAHADPYVPAMPLSAVKKEELPDGIGRRIFVFERGSQFDLLSENPETFMWVSPLPGKLLERYGLLQRECADNQRIYRDVLIYRADHALSELEKCFLTELCESKRKYL